MDNNVYEIGGKKFYQRPLCNLQQTMIEEMLFDTFKGGEISADDPQTFFRALGKNRGQLMAICLIPDGLSIKEFVGKLQKLGYVAKQWEWFDLEAGPGDRYKAITDFFVCNQIGLCIDSLTNLMAWTTEKMQLPGSSLPANGLNKSAPLPQEETPTAETPSVR